LHVIPDFVEYSGKCAIIFALPLEKTAILRYNKYVYLHT